MQIPQPGSLFTGTGESPAIGGGGGGLCKSLRRNGDVVEGKKTDVQGGNQKMKEKNTQQAGIRGQIEPSL